MSQEKTRTRRGFKKNYGLKHVRLIQAGMGVGVSSWHLANTTARHRGVIGTVSGIASEDIVTRSLQKGDRGGHFRRALHAFPFPEIGKAIVEKYFVKGGIPAGQKFRAHSVFDLHPSRELQQLMVASEFALVWLAKEGHKGLVSVNYLEKIQITHIWYILGAMLAGVNFVTMGAGIILQVPKVLDDYTAGVASSYKVDVVSFDKSSTPGNEATTAEVTFNPEELLGGKLPKLRRPGLIAIVSGDFLAKVLIKKCHGKIDGFVIEFPTAGGHNAPPRGRDKRFNERGEPLYAEAPGEKDYVDLEEFRKIKSRLGIPFWLAGSYGSPEGYEKARSAGANGVQVGSAFALSRDSGILPHLRDEARYLGYKQELRVDRSTRSPTGYPFNIAHLEGTLSDDTAYSNRKRACSICALRVPYQQAGKIGGYRCSAEPTVNWLRKGGKPEEAENSMCLCNGLMATIGLGNPGELPIVTLGKSVEFLHDLMSHERDSYSAVDVIDYILQRKKK